MENQNEFSAEEIFSKALRAGRRTYFFDVRETKAGDYYLTITESKKFTNEDGTFYYKKHKIYLYKEDFDEFKNSLNETCNFIIDEKGSEVISEKHDKDFDSKKEKEKEKEKEEEKSSDSENTDEEKDIADVDFENDDQ
ncbi:MAG: PUR family DNA/RNA-binding protein [Bacteroidota bacterium]|nr:PUR family DNA/RNA-binding protein [Bacteroidota bacterium]